MNRKVDIEQFTKFVDTFKTRLDCAREIGISSSHLYGMMNGSISMGEKTQKKIEKLLDDRDLKLEDLLEPQPIKIGDKLFKEIVVYKKANNELVCGINSQNIIADNDYIVECVPL